MTPYGSSTQTAIAALSRLAEAYDDGSTRLSATEIADSRGLQRPFVGKILSKLSHTGIITGSRGPGGGFTFARHPKEVTLYEVYRIFEREDFSSECPFGGGICGVGDKCPLHDKLVDVKRAMDRVLHETNFDTFRRAYKKSGGQTTWRFDATEVLRQSYRANKRS